MREAVMLVVRQRANNGMFEGINRTFAVGSALIYDYSLAKCKVHF